MDVDVFNHEAKLKLLLGKFLENGFKLNNDVYFNTLLSHLAGKDDKGPGGAMLNLSLFPDWILEATTLWESTGKQPDASIAALALQIASLLSAKESSFKKLLDRNLCSRLISVLQIQNPDKAPSVKLAYIKLLSACSQHKTGLEWVIKNRYWEDALKFSLTNQTIYITKEGQNFVILFLRQAMAYDEIFCVNVVQQIMDLLLKNTLVGIKNNGNVLEMSDDELVKLVTPALNLVSFILESVFLSSLEFSEVDMKIASIFYDKMDIETCIQNYIMICHNTGFLFELEKVSTLVKLIKVVQHCDKGVCPLEILKAYICKTNILFSSNINKGKLDVCLKQCSLGLYLWNKFISKIKVPPIIENNQTILLENQYLIILLLPTFSVNDKYCFKGRGCSEEMLKEDTFRDLFVDKLFKMLCPNTIRIAYSWRNSLSTQQNIFDFALKGIHITTQVRSILPRETAIVAFQVFVYTMKDLVMACKYNPQSVEIFSQQQQFVTQILDGIALFIQDFNISWRDSLESICVLNIGFEFLSIPTWPYQFVVSGLKLVKIAILKYMSPNLALLVDRITDSPVALLGPLLYAKLHDAAWQVRDSALEVINVIAEVSRCKFPSLQKVVADADLPSLILQMGLRDGESFVRATSLKCLSQLTLIKEFWEDNLANLKIIQQMMQVLKIETEGIVRAEAAALITSINQYHPISPDLIPSVYDCMANAALSDLHWEVRMKALDFWNDLIQDHLKKQGMIDGAFPSFTFSGELRKIVQLTKTEIAKRLKRVLERLSETGCLTVLVLTISEDCDLQVSRKALGISQKLTNFLRSYDVDVSNGQERMEIPIPPSPSSTSSSASSGVFVSPRQSDDGDEVINQILASSDNALLQDVYCPDGDEVQSTDSGYSRPRRNVTPSEFITFSKQNLDKFVSDREKWMGSMDSLGSLLSDMLHSYGHDDLNLMDCY